MLSPWMVFNHSIYIYISYPYISSTRAHTRLGASQASARRQAFQCRYPRVLGYLGTSWLCVSSSASSSFFSFIFFFHPSPFTFTRTVDHGPWMGDGGVGAIGHHHHPPHQSSSAHGEPKPFPFPFPFPGLLPLPFWNKRTSERERERERARFRIRIRIQLEEGAKVNPVQCPVQSSPVNGNFLSPRRSKVQCR